MVCCVAGANEGSMLLQTSDLMEAAIALALRSRLREHTEITPRVSCTALGLMEGRFEGMQIVGRGWRTPLELTAQVLEVRVATSPLPSYVLVPLQPAAA